MMKMNIELKMRRERRNLIIRRILYFVIAFFAFIILSTVRTELPSPLILIPIAICTAVFENGSPIYCSFFGAFCGLLLDFAGDTLVSFNGIILAVCSMFTSLLFLFYLHRQPLNFFLLDCLAILIQGLLHYLFFFLLWGYDESGGIFKEVFIPEFIATGISGIFIYILYKIISKFLGEVTDHYIEDDNSGKTM